MHVWHCDVTNYVTAPFNDIMCENKMMHFGHAYVQSVPTKYCLKMAIEQENHGHGTPRVPGVLHNATYVYNILAMGLSNATDLFETCIHEVLQGLNGCTNIADDVLVYGTTYGEFKTNVIFFLDHCEQEDMYLNPDMVKIDCPEVPFFSNILSKDELSPDTRKVELIQK